MIADLGTESYARKTITARRVHFSAPKWGRWLTARYEAVARERFFKGGSACEASGMDNSGMSIRPASDADKEAIFALAPRLAEGVAPWRDHNVARDAGRRWLADSLAAAAAGDGTVLVAADGGRNAGGTSGRPGRAFTG